MEVVQHHPAVPEPGRDRLADGLRLLHDLLEHEMGIAALFCRGHVPVHLVMLLFHRHQLVVKHVDAVRRQHGDLPVVHIGHIPGVLDDGRHVGGKIVAVLTKAQDQRAVLPGGNEGIGIVGTDDAQGVGALDAPQAPAHGLQHAVALVVVIFQQLGYHLRVRVGGEDHAQLLQVFLDLQIVFDDAVVHQSDGTVLADMGMGVDVVGLAVGSPAGVSDAKAAVQIGAAVDHIAEHLQPALALFHLETMLFRAHGHTGRVIAPVFHPGQAVQQDRRRLLPSHISNNSAHKMSILLINRLPKGQTRSICRFSRGHSVFVLRSPAYLCTVYAAAATEGHPPNLRYSPHLVILRSPAGAWRYDGLFPMSLLSLLRFDW